MTVIRPNSISGITSLTAHRGSIDFYAHDGSAATFNNINSNVTSGVSTFASLNITGDLDVGGALTYEDVTNIDSVGVITARNAIVISEDNAIHFRGTAADDADAILRASAGGGQLLINSRNDTIINIDSNNDSTDAHFAIGHGAATGSSTELFEVRENGNVTQNSGTFTIKAVSGDSSGLKLSQESGDESRIFNHFSGPLTFGTGNTERLRITSAGTVNIGDQGLADEYIGSTVKIRKDQNSVTRLSLRNENSGSGSASAIQVGAHGNSWMLQCGSAANDSNAFTIRVDGTANSNTGTERLRITTAGWVGINQPNPEQSLHVKGTSGDTVPARFESTGAQSRIGFKASGTASSYHVACGAEANDFIVYTNNTERLRITSGGFVGVNCTPFAQFHVKTGTNANISMSTMSSEASIEAYNDAGSASVPLRLRASVHKFFIGSTEGLRVHTNGLIGVGHDSPTAYGRMTVAMPSQSGGAAIQVANSSLGSGDGSTSNIVLRSVNNSGSNWADAEYRASQHIFAIQGSEKFRISSSGLAINKTTAADAEIEILQSADPTLRLYDTRNAAYKADLLMAGSAPLLRNNNSTASDRTFVVQKGLTDHLVIEGNGAVRKPLTPSFFSRPPGGYNFSSVQVVIGGTWSNVHNIGSHFSNGTFTAPVAGTYQFTWSCFSQNETTRFDAFILVNGTNVMREEINGYPSTPANKSGSVHGCYYLSANDYVTFGVYSAGTTNIYAQAAPWTYACGFLVG